MRKFLSTLPLTIALLASGSVCFASPIYPQVYYSRSSADPGAPPGPAGNLWNLFPASGLTLTSGGSIWFAAYLPYSDDLGGVGSFQVNWNRIIVPTKINYGGITANSPTPTAWDLLADTGTANQRWTLTTPTPVSCPGCLTGADNSMWNASTVYGQMVMNYQLDSTPSWLYFVASVAATSPYSTLKITSATASYTQEDPIVNVATVPEPSTLSLFGLALVVLTRPWRWLGRRPLRSHLP